MRLFQKRPVQRPPDVKPEVHARPDVVHAPLPPSVKSLSPDTRDQVIKEMRSELFALRAEVDRWRLFNQRP
jgi:hypothetical protein